MTRADAEAFSALLAGLAEVYDVTLTPTRTELYYRALEDLPLSAVREAVHHAVRESRFFPKPADLRDWAGADAESAAELAWLGLLEAFQRGYDGCVLPDDPITQALVSVYWGSGFKAREWWRFCHEAALEGKHKEFVGRYQNYAMRPAHELPRLPGGDVFTALEEASRHALPARTDRGDGRPAALSLPDLRLDVGLQLTGRPHALSRPGEASEAPEASPAAEESGL